MIRNVANLVPDMIATRAIAITASAAIEYAVRMLKVENIIIMGHSDCGGIKSLVQNTPIEDSFIDTWLDIARTQDYQNYRAKS